MDFKEYVKELDRLFQVGNTTEHSFRGTLQTYLSSLLLGYVVTNEPRRFECGAPDYVITKKGLPVAFFEAKDIDDGDLDGRKAHKEQFNRYKTSLDGIAFTDYLDFHFYEEGEFVDAVRIAETRGNHIVGIPDNKGKFEELILHLVTKGRQKITSSSALARQMAAKAHLLAETVRKTIALEGEDSDTEMATQLRAFRDVLIHDLKAEEFADIYAQTIVYGMFTARLNDKTPESFSRKEAAELIPKTNPFLRKIFQSIAGYDLDSNIEWIVDDLASMFVATDAAKIMKNYGSNNRHSDPIVHFYEDFLAEYDPKLRKARGVWYTPAPVVKFIVKSVDDILQTEFGLPRGLADDSTIKVKRAIEQSRDRRTADGMKHEEIEIPRVQILDPATGTGTFLAEIIQQIRDKFNGLEGMWPSYVEKSLIPRIHGFEILMASYTIAHLKLALTLKNTGYEGQTNKRLNVFLTNSLEEATPRATTLFAKWLSDEADAASMIKQDAPIMIATGNPPYSGESSNKGEWISALMEDYKKEPGGLSKLNEKNPKWINDDYVKFIRLAQHFIEKNGEGIVAFINPHGYLDNPTFRGMRWALLTTFDKIYTLDLHGNAKKKEVCPDGTKDENVFDIMQGVSINFFIRTKQKTSNSLAEVWHAELFGLREDKYNYLSSNSISTVSYKRVQYTAPMYFFVPKDFRLATEYDKGFGLNELFLINNVGIVTANDGLNVSFSKEEQKEKIRELLSIPEQEWRNKYNRLDTRDWTYSGAKSDANKNVNDEKNLVRIAYRPFDIRYTLFTGLSRGLYSYPRTDVMKHLFHGDNLAIVAKKGFPKTDAAPAFITNFVSDFRYWSCSGMQGGDYVFPLWVFDKDDNKYPNLDETIINRLKNVISCQLSPDDIVSFIYAILHSPKYRETYKEFLKIDFPRIPYPKDADQFNRLAEKGAELRKLHLMEDAGAWKTGVTFPVPGSNLIESISFSEGIVYINKEQYFGNVSELAWYFFIGGYQPAQKWLKDRKGRALDYQDILHYGHIVYALEETYRIMKEIDEIWCV